MNIQQEEDGVVEEAVPLLPNNEPDKEDDVVEIQLQEEDNAVRAVISYKQYCNPILQHTVNILGILAGLTSIAMPVYDFCLNGLEATEALPAYQLVQDAYSILFGFMMIWLEATEFLNNKNPYRQAIRNWFFFISTMGGRGIIYIFLGSFFIVQGSVHLVNLITGIYIIATGLFCIIYGFRQGENVMNMMLLEEEDKPTAGKFIYNCAAPGCKKKAYKLQCPTCNQQNLPKPTSFFCSQKHFDESWKEHKKLHPTKAGTA